MSWRRIYISIYLCEYNSASVFFLWSDEGFAVDAFRGQRKWVHDGQLPALSPPRPADSAVVLLESRRRDMSSYFFFSFFSYSLYHSNRLFTAPHLVTTRSAYRGLRTRACHHTHTHTHTHAHTHTRTHARSTHARTLYIFIERENLSLWVVLYVGLANGFWCFICFSLQCLLPFCASRFLLCNRVISCLCKIGNGGNPIFFLNPTFDCTIGLTVCFFFYLFLLLFSFFVNGNTTLQETFCLRQCGCNKIVFRLTASRCSYPSARQHLFDHVQQLGLYNPNSD